MYPASPTSNVDLVRPEGKANFDPDRTEGLLDTLTYPSHLGGSVVRRRVESHA